ncbi:unnamed protein product [Didymodactylos carnosus]|uniref:Beta-lactamase-related domain-containing protein n=1 Tax=Didymodactylos carnosus TaxID=1234261 RepID=A0A814ZP90_9BILA|nr:unnamed protein product [Didymodactylos carnosus]CAF4009141.1 unnamed protein product [Didymodactylos carnosus]
MPFVSCIGKNQTNDSFVDWAPFVSANHRQHSFTFFNLTRLTYLTFTNFSSTFHLHGESIDLTFINGMDEIGENAFQPLNEYSDSSIELTFTSPQHFKLADYAFGQGAYYEIDIDNIQYSHIHNLPYQLNLKSMDGARFYQMNIRNCGDIEFISNGSSTIELIGITVNNCSLANASLLIESLSTGLAGLDLTSNHLTAIPSLEYFQQLRAVDLKNNFIEEITVNIFNNMASLWRLDLSNNRIRNIESDSFVGLRLTELNLDNNRLTSLQTLTIDNQTTSFLYPLNESLALLVISNNFLHDLNPLKHMTNLNNVIVCCNQIKTLDGNIFEKAHQLKSVDLSYNQIEFIDSMTFNGTIINYLNLAGNRFSSLETNESLSSNTSLFKNQTSSFLYPISSTISSLSFSNCTNLIEINWFIIIKLQTLFYLDLSEVNMTEKSWLYRKTDVNSEDSSINWNYPPGPRIILYGIRLTDNDYCLTKLIIDILNKTTLIRPDNNDANLFNGVTSFTNAKIFNGLTLMDGLINNEIQQGFPGAALIIIQYGKILKQTVYGYKLKYNENETLIEQPELLILYTMFDVASLTKIYATNYTFMHLVEQGKLNVDDQVIKYIPEYSGCNLDNECRETRLIKDLLTHTAGYAPSNRTEQIIETKLHFQRSRGDDPLPIYSNIDYMLLDLIVESISGISIDQYIKINMYQSLSLTHTLFNPLVNTTYQKMDFAATELNGNTRNGAIMFPNVRIHVLQGQVHDEKSFYLMNGISGHAGLFSNLHDMTILCQIMLNNGTYGIYSVPK